MNRLLPLFALALTACGSDAVSIDTGDQSTATTDVAPFDTPESALWSASEDAWFISNIAGDSEVADGIGWIAKLDADGDVLNPRWLDGLNAPKGMAMSSGNLFVADLTDLLEIDVSTGDILNRIPVPDALFLNDVTASADTVWISDTFLGAIYAYTPATQTVTTLVQDPALASINGLEFDGTQILGGTTGDFFDLEDLGDVVRISTTGEVTVLSEDAAKIDGIVQDGTGFLATDFRGMLLSIDADGDTTVLRDLIAEDGMLSAADLGYNPQTGRVAIPDLFASTVVFIDLGAK